MATIPLESLKSSESQKLDSSAEQPTRNAMPSTRLTREGYQFVFMLMFVWLAAILQNVNLLVLLAGAFCCMLLIQWRIASATLWGLRAKRYVPHGVEARKPFVVLVTVVNQRRWLASWLLMVHENFAVQLGPRNGLWQPGQGLTLIVKRLLPGESQETSYNCIVPRRGSYRFHQMELSTRFPFGLMRGRLDSCESQTVLVRPAIGKLNSNWRKTLSLPQNGQTRRAASVSGGDGEFYGLRSYRAGDTLRWIHWRTSAKRNELLVRQFERDEKQSLIAVLDLYQEPKSPVEADVLDQAIEIFATLVTQIVQRDKSLATVSILDHQPSLIYRSKSLQQLNLVLDRLAIATTGKADLLLESMRAIAQRNSASEPILVISTRPMPQWLVTSENALDETINGSLQKLSEHVPIARPSFYNALRWLNVKDESWKSLFERG